MDEKTYNNYDKSVHIESEVNTLAESIVPNSGTHKVESNKKISLWSLILLLIGSVIGTGIFISVDGIANSVPSIFYSLLIWVVCGLVSLGAGLCYVELGSMFPSCGAEYTYFLHAYHPWLAFSFMFTSFLFIRPCSIAILVVYFAETCLQAIDPKISTWYISLLSVGCVAFLCTLNCCSNYWSIKLNDFLTYSKFICLGIIISLGIYKLSRGEFENIQDWGFRVSISAAAASRALNDGFWSYDGFNALAFVVEDIDNLKRNLLLASVIGMSIIIIFYLITNFSYIVILGINRLSQSGKAAQAATEIYMGKWSIIVIILIALSSFGSGNATAFCSVRIYFDAARNGHLPRILASSHKKQKTMIPALIIQAIITSIIILCEPNLKSLLLYFTGSSWVFYTLAIVAVIIFRFKRKQEQNILRLPLVLVGLLACSSASVVILGFIQDWERSLVSISLILISLPVYIIFIYFGPKFPRRIHSGIDKATNFLLNFLQCEVSEKPM